MQNQQLRFNSNGLNVVIDPQGMRQRVKICGLFSFVVLLLCSFNLFAASSQALGYAPKYQQGFKNFDYVNPDAPKTGELTLSAFGNYSTLNPYVLKGIAPAGMADLTIETLMEQSWDEPYSVYGLIAEDIKLAEDKLSVTFRINPKAKFSDGKPITAEDVKFTFDTLRSEKAHPFYRFYWVDVKDATVIDKQNIRFNFSKHNPELHLILAQMPVFAKHWIGKKHLTRLSQINR